MENTKVKYSAVVTFAHKRVQLAQHSSGTSVAQVTQPLMHQQTHMDVSSAPH